VGRSPDACKLTTAAGFTLITVCVAAPAFTALILPLAALYYYTQRYYLRTSRELKRLDSVSKSPILGHFQESLMGIATIRAYRQVSRFTLENEWRVDANMRAYFPSVNANRWLAVRLEFIGSTVILFGSLFAVAAVGQGGGPSAPLLGLAMAYALQITSALNWIVRQTVEVETNIVSVERVLEYANLPSEAPEIISKNRPPISWPAQGGVQFRNYSARYRPELDLVLRDVDLSFRPREKIGVVGRTGAGKSTLTLALFRIIEASEGYISIDDLDTSKIGLLDLRGRLAIIPQDAALFEGSIRDNLDPSHIHDDTELWNALGNVSVATNGNANSADHARLKDHVAGMEGKLDAQINEGGSNLSQGQRQLVSLARALLAPSNILVLDEATVSVSRLLHHADAIPRRPWTWRRTRCCRRRCAVAASVTRPSSPLHTASTRSSTRTASWCYSRAAWPSSTRRRTSCGGGGCFTSWCARRTCWGRWRGSGWLATRCIYMY
jgi:ATP-binding cassette subfamily C (CFTR/MRP) protein 1